MVSNIAGFTDPFGRRLDCGDVFLYAAAPVDCHVEVVIDYQ